METRFLETFVAVAEKGSFAEAARRLDLTPAAIAQRIRALESEIGVALLSRSGRTVTPTEAGVAILGQTRILLKQVRDLGSIATSGQPTGELRLGAISSALSGLLPTVLKVLMQRLPGIDVYILPGTSEDLYRKVLDGDIDAAIITQPPFAIPKTCNWQLVREEPLVVLVAASAPPRNAHAILASEPFIRYERTRWGGRLVDGYLRRAGIRPRERYELHALDAIAVLVDRGLGVSLLPDWAPPWPEGLSLRKLPIADRTFARRIGILWARSSVRLRLVQSFVKEASVALFPPQKIATRRKGKGAHPFPTTPGNASTNSRNASPRVSKLRN